MKRETTNIGFLSLRFLQLLPLTIILLVWQILVFCIPQYDFTVGSPSGIAKEFAISLIEGTLVRDTAITAIETIIGFIIGSLGGTTIGLTLWFSKSIFKVFKPYLIAVGVIPMFALGPILIFWFGTGIWSKIVLVILSTFVIALVQSYTGAMETDADLIKMTQVFGGGRWQTFINVVFPSSIIWVLSGIRLSIGMGLLGAFVGEFISSRMGLGHFLILAEGFYNVNQIWVGIICIVGLALGFHSITYPIEKWTEKWK